MSYGDSAAAIHARRDQEIAEYRKALDETVAITRAHLADTGPDVGPTASLLTVSFLQQPTVKVAALAALAVVTLAEMTEEVSA